MRVLVLGGTGMLGHVMARELGQRHEVRATARPGVMAEHAKSLAGALSCLGPGDVVVNCIGLVKQRPADPEQVIFVNGQIPHRLHIFCNELGLRLIHFSTDCVFSGRRGMYTEDHTPDATDLYGRSKLLGEVAGTALTLRTSIIGPELGTTQGLLAWFLANRGGRVDGYRNAIFSGLTTLALARLVGRVLVKWPELSGLYHVSADPISKHDLLWHLNVAYSAGVEIVPVDEPRVDRSLDSKRFRTVTGWEPQPWPEMVAEMAADS